MRRAPWVLAAGAVVAVGLRLASSDWDLAPIAGGVLLVVAFIPYVRRAERAAKNSGEEVGALYACATPLPYQLVRHQPRFRRQMESVRRAWLVGGWLPGTLFVTASGVAWKPTARASKIFRAPPIEIPWTEVTRAAAGDRIGPRDPGVLEIRTVDGTEVAFSIIGRERLADALRAALPRQATPPD